MMKTETTLSIRRFTRDDAGQLLKLMQSLARFEGYDKEFAVTERDLLQRGLGDSPEFEALVAEDTRNPGELLGMAVYYFVPYTFDLRPDLILKELFVASDARSMGAGRALMQQLEVRAKEANCKRIKWLVLPDNVRAKRFYASLGARHDADWENWSMRFEND